jgi:hypothetical protein
VELEADEAALWEPISEAVAALGLCCEIKERLNSQWRALIRESAAQPLFPRGQAQIATLVREGPELDATVGLILVKGLRYLGSHRD